MSLWLRKTAGLNSSLMRDIAEGANVEWDHQSIVYKASGIGYSNGSEDDLDVIQDAAEDLLGYRPQPYDPPERDDHS